MTTKNRIKCYMKTGLYDEAEKSFFVWVNIFIIQYVYCVCTGISIRGLSQAQCSKIRKNTILGSHTV